MTDRNEHSAAQSATSDGAPGTTSSRTQEIIRVASRLFRQKGYHAVGMREIAEDCGIQAPSLYKHFSSKSEILRAIVDSVTTRFIAAQLDSVDDARSYRDQLREILVHQLRYLMAHRDTWWVSTHELRGLTPEALKAVQARRRLYQDRLIELIAKGIERGEFGDCDPTLAALAMSDMMNGVNGWLRSDGSMSHERLADEYASMIVDRLLAPLAAPAPRPARRGASSR